MTDAERALLLMVAKAVHRIGKRQIDRKFLDPSLIPYEEAWLDRLWALVKVAEAG